MGARGVDLREVDGDDEVLRPVDGGLGEDLTAGAGHEALAPELDAVAADRPLDPDAVHRGDEAAVGHRVRALDGLPREVLVGAELLLLRRMPADRRGEEEDLRAVHRGEARAFRIPLVPADEHADAAEPRGPRLEPEVARREIELLVVQRVVRDVHLAVDAQQGAVGVDDGGGVVVEAFGPLLEERRDDDDAVLLGELLERRGARPGDAFGETEVRVVLVLAEVLRPEELLRADDLRAVLRRAGGCGEGGGEVVLGVGAAGVLQEPQRDGAAFGGGSAHEILALSRSKMLAPRLGAAGGAGSGGCGAIRVVWPRDEADAAGAAASSLKSSRMNLPSVSLVGP